MKSILKDPKTLELKAPWEVINGSRRRKQPREVVDRLDSKSNHQSEEVMMFPDRLEDDSRSLYMRRVRRVRAVSSLETEWRWECGAVVECMRVVVDCRSRTLPISNGTQ